MASRTMRRFYFFWTLLMATSLAFGQGEKSGAEAWAPLRYFLGEWEGTSKGRPGTGRVEREYRMILGGKFLEERNKSTYEPQERNPRGEVHEDWGIFSYDRARQRFVLRQFHVEGFINQYALDHLAPDGKTIVCVSESIENIPAGWRAKETYRILADDEFVTIFELAAPDGDFEVYSESHLRRKR